MPDHDDRRARFRGAFLGCALGDAIGRPFEMISVTDSRLRPGLDRLLSRPRTLAYSDDTEMMMSVAESLVRCAGVDPEDVMSTLAANHDPARGYGHGMKRALEAFQRGEGATGVSTWAEGSRGSGGAVRNVAIACAYHDDLALVADRADRVAVLTHASPVARAGAVVHAVALANVLASRDASVGFARVTRGLDDHPLVTGTSFGAKLAQVRELVAASADARAAVEALGNGVLADEAVPLALFAFLRWGPSFASVVSNSVLCGGDTDTVAAMAGALCGALVGEAGLPSEWVARLENGPKGADHLRDLADATSASLRAPAR